MKSFGFEFGMVFLVAFLVSASVVSAQTVIAAPSDVVARIDNNFDLRSVQENTKQAEVALSRMLSPFYYPEINASVQYQDNQQVPLSPFLPARTKDVYWDTYVESRLPYGVTLQAGQEVQRSRFGQASPPNPLLPYPATFFQPQFFIRASLSLTRDFIGGETRRQIGFAKGDVKSAKIQEELTKHQLTVTALGMYYQIPTLIAIRQLSADVIKEYQRLEKSISRKVSRSLTEKSDLFNIRRAIATQEALLKDTDSTILEIKNALSLMLGDATLQIEPSITLDGIAGVVGTCEDKILTTPFSFDLSMEEEFHQIATDKGDLQAKYYKWGVMPDFTLQTAISTTGTESKLGPAIKKQWTFNYPIFEIGAFLKWQTSPYVRKTAKEGSAMRQRIAYLNRDQRFEEQQSVWNTTKQKIALLREKQAHLLDAVDDAEKELDDLRRQYDNGRLTLFQLIDQRANLFLADIQEKRATQDRLNNLSDSLQYFDRVQCPLFAVKSGGKS